MAQEEIVGVSLERRRKNVPVRKVKGSKGIVGVSLERFTSQRKQEQQRRKSYARKIQILVGEQRAKVIGGICIRMAVRRRRTTKEENEILD